MKRAVLLVLLLACAHPVAHSLEPYRVPGFTFTPPAIYITWFAQAHNCAFRLRAVMGDSANFTVDSQAVDLSTITWVGVPTERMDQRFLGAISPKRDSMYVWGMTSGHGDTVWLSAQRLESEILVKHEAMHIFVQSPTEFNYGPHGLPWGFCEWL